MILLPLRSKRTPSGPVSLPSLASSSISSGAGGGGEWDVAEESKVRVVCTYMSVFVQLYIEFHKGFIGCGGKYVVH